VLEIRRYRRADHDAVMRLHVVAMERIGAYKDDGPWDDDLHDIEGAYLSGGGEFLVGLLDGRLAAMGALRRTDAGRAEVKRMRVDPDFQGRGLGQQMWDALEARARELGYKVLHLETSVRQTAAQGLYTKNGFRETGRAVLEGFDCIFYEKRLDGTE
jgi:ribosomal protein S18 acetylase RimI-like enzyme